MERLLIRDAILIASNTMLRVGELWQLKWKDIIGIDDVFDENKKRVSLVTINVRAEISNVRKSRRIPVRGGDYVKRVQARAKLTGPGDFVFCAIGKNTKVRAHTWYDHRKVIMNAIDIPDYVERQLTWYSLLHFGITCCIRAKVLLSDIAQLAGTSVAHIENTYGHFDNDMLRDASVKNFSVDTYGISHKD